MLAFASAVGIFTVLAEAIVREPSHAAAHDSLSFPTWRAGQYAIHAELCDCGTVEVQACAGLRKHRVGQRGRLKHDLLACSEAAIDSVRSLYLIACAFAASG